VLTTPEELERDARAESGDVLRLSARDLDAEPYPAHTNLPARPSTLEQTVVGRQRGPTPRYSPSVESDRERALLTEMSDSFNRLELMAADLHPTHETDLAKAELVGGLTQELESLRSGMEELKQALGE